MNVMNAMSDEARAQRLDAFLAARDVTRDMLAEAADAGYSDPLLVVASGSILHGVGNQRSDIDLNIVVEQRAMPLPVAAFARRLLVDSMYFTVEEAQAWEHAIRDQPWPRSGSMNHRAWRSHADMLVQTVRFGYGLVLSARGDWEGWALKFREPWLAEHVARWWQVESIRRRVAARWLAPTRPLLAAQRALDAVLAALESRAASAGQPFFGAKWMSEKLHLTGDTEGLEIFRRIMESPRTPADALAYVTRCESLLDGIGHSFVPGLAAQLWFQTGVTLHPQSGRTLVSRWKLRGVELAGSVPALSTPPQPIWEGPADTMPPAVINALFTEDMTWLSIVSRQ